MAVKSDKGHSKITLEYNLHPTMYTLKVEAVALNVYDLKLNRGMEYQLLVGVGPTNTFYRKMNVTAKPRDVVKITQNGTILALRKGTAVVTAECGGVKAECAVTVGAYESFTIERALDGVSETNPVGSIVAGMSYQNVFNVGDSEKEMLELTVEMRGTDVTGSCVVMAEDNASAQIKMASVTGNTAGTIARTAVLLLALTNQMLSAMGKSPLPIESTTVEQLVTAGITTIAALIAWWKNNSFTKEAIAADKEYDRLKAKSGK